MTDPEEFHRFAAQEMLAERYLLGELGGSDKKDFEEHLFECSICFEQLKAGLEFTEAIARPMFAPRRKKSLWQRIKDWRNRRKVQS